MKTSTVAASVVVIASVVAVARAVRVDPGGVVTAATDTVGEWKEAIMPTDIDLNNGNLRAFLAVIRHAEGTERHGANAYRVRFGGSLVEGNLTDHPGGVVCANLAGGRICSSAVGAYQFLKKTWDWIAADLPDFGQASQDLAAARLIRYRGALGDVYRGDVAEAVRKCRKEWASLPGAGYGQPEKSLASLQAKFVASGGVLGVA